LKEKKKKEQQERRRKQEQEDEEELKAKAGTENDDGKTPAQLRAEKRKDKRREKKEKKDRQKERKEMKKTKSADKVTNGESKPKTQIVKEGGDVQNKKASKPEERMLTKVDKPAKKDVISISSKGKLITEEDGEEEDGDEEEDEEEKEESAEEEEDEDMVDAEISDDDNSDAQSEQEDEADEEDTPIIPIPELAASETPTSPIHSTTSDPSTASSAPTSTSESTISTHKTPKDPLAQQQLKDRLALRIEELRAKRKADSGAQPRNRTELIEQRRKRDEQRKERKKQMRLQAKVEEAKTAPSTTLAIIPISEPIAPENNFSFGRIAFDDGNQLNATADTIQVTKQKRGPTDVLGKMKQAEAKKARLASMPDEKREVINEKDRWSKALKLASGEKVRDDETLLKKSVKRQESAKRKSEKEWYVFHIFFHVCARFHILIFLISFFLPFRLSFLFIYIYHSMRLQYILLSVQPANVSKFSPII